MKKITWFDLEHLKSETEKAWKRIRFPAFFLFQQNFESAVHQSCPLAKLYVTHAPGKPTLPLTTRLEHIAEICRNLYHLQLHIIMNFPRSNFDLLKLLVVGCFLLWADHQEPIGFTMLLPISCGCCVWLPSSWWSVDLILYFWWPEAQVFVGHEGKKPWTLRKAVQRPLTVVLGKFWTSDKTVSACVGNSSRFRHFWQREEGATLVIRDFPVKSQWRHILRHLHQRCSEYKRIWKAGSLAEVRCESTGHVFFGGFSLPNTYGLCHHTSHVAFLHSWCPHGIGQVDAEVKGAFKVNGGVVHTIHWDSLGELQKQNTETRKIGWYWHWCYLYGVSLSSLVFKPWPSMWHRVWITSATSCHKNFFKNPKHLLPKKSIDFSHASDYHSLNIWNSNLPPKLNRNKLWIELMKFNECFFCTIT